MSRKPFDSWGDGHRLPDITDPAPDYPEEVAHDAAALAPAPEAGDPTNPGKRAAARARAADQVATAAPVVVEPRRERIGIWIALVAVLAFLGAYLGSLAAR